MAMTKSHQLFLQTFMTHGVLNAKQVFHWLKTSTDRYGGEQKDERQQLVDFVHLINNCIKPYGMEIKKVIDEYDGANCYCLVNTTESNITLFATRYSGGELEFFKVLVEMVVLSEHGTVGSIAAVNIVDSLTKKMTKADAEHLLKRLEKDKWISKTQNGKVFLAARTLIELEQYILEMYSESVVKCNLCKRLCIQGDNCSHCVIRIHKHCAQQFFRPQTNNKCPACNKTWNTEESVMASIAGSRVSHKSSTQTGKRKANN